MTMRARIAVATVAAVGVASLIAAAGLLVAVHATLDPWSAHFAMMRSMMGAAPDVAGLYRSVDVALAVAFVLAVAIALAAGTEVGAHTARRVAEIDRALTAFAAGRFETRVSRGSGPAELERIATSANAMATEIVAARTAERELIAGLAHDLAHPLTALRGTFEAARDGLAEGIASALAVRLIATVETMEATLDDLRDVSAFDAGVIRLDLEEVDLRECVQRALVRYRDAARVRGIALRDATTDTPLTIRGDPRRLDRVIANLVENALAASPSGTTVTIGASGGNAEEGELFVEDEAGATGAERLRRAFTGGSAGGLGLRVVRSLVTAMSGRVSMCEGRRGSRVAAIFPVQRGFPVVAGAGE